MPPETATWSLALLLIAAMTIAVIRMPDTHFDDAYMFLRYARNALAGYGHAWNRGEPPVYGSTSVLHFGWVTLCEATLTGSDEFKLRFASWLPLVALIPLLGLAGARSCLSPWLAGRGGAISLLVALCLAISGAVLYHAASGMDTTLGMCTNALLALAVLLERQPAREANPMGVQPPPSRGRFLFVLAAAYATFLARPDNGLIAVGLPILAYLCWHPQEYAWRRAILFGASFFVILCVDAIAKQYFLGSPLPLPFYVKQTGYQDQFRNLFLGTPFRQLASLAVMWVPLWLALAWGWRPAMVRMLAPWLIPVAATWCYYFTVVQVMGHGARFYMPSFPLVFLAALWAIDDRLTQPASPARRGTGFVRIAATALAIPLTYWGCHQLDAWILNGLRRDISPSLYAAILADNSGFDREQRTWWQSVQDVAGWASRLPPGTRIAASEHGLLSARGPQLVIIDLAGLHNAELARRGFSAERFFATQPDVIWGPHEYDRHTSNPLLASDQFWQEYEYYPRLFRFGLAIRKNSPQAAEIKAIVDPVVCQLYGQTLAECRVRSPRGRQYFRALSQLRTTGALPHSTAEVRASPPVDVLRPSAQR